MPPLGDSSIKSLDVPVAGRGYNTLPFVFDLVNLANKIPLPLKATSKKIGEPQADDEDGSGTVAYLEKVKKLVGLITGTGSASLGLHPVIYFYGRNGNFQPISFLVAAEFLSELGRTNKLANFVKVRKLFEDFLLNTNHLAWSDPLPTRIFE